jgi:hypothetical protein
VQKPVRTSVMQRKSPIYQKIRAAFAIGLMATVLPAYAEEKGNATVLNPDNYVGQVKAGYAAAKEIPEVCAKLFCYCGCDLTDCHASLLDCFTSDHGVDCHICQEESILALSFHRKGKSLSDIQKFIDKRYAKEYPFEVESPGLQKYKKERLWDAGKKASLETNASSSKKSKLNKDGSCCSGGKKDPKSD